MKNAALVLRAPTKSDGYNVFKLISSIPELDDNSCYCNLLQCTHFSDTSIIAETDGKALGFISGYRKPDSNTLFIWQVAVSADARGQGLASQMLQNLLKRPDNQTIEQIETTITADNAPSWALFKSIAKQLNASLQQTLFFDQDTDFHGAHASEFLVTIGPALQSSTATLN